MSETTIDGMRQLYMTETTIYNRDNYIWQWQLFITKTTIYNRDNYI